MSKDGTQRDAMSNLITDMALQGASPKELARVIKRSMDVIDAEKHNKEGENHE